MRRRRSETDDELRFHLEMRVRDYLERGMSEGEARRAAARRLGDIERVRRECERVAEREARSRRRREWFGELWRDVRYGVRTLLRVPTFSVMAILTLTVGIGATTAVFSVVHGVLLAPLPYPDPDRLVRLWEVTPEGGERNVVSPGNVVDWRSRAESFAALGGHNRPYGMTLTGDDGVATRVSVLRIQPSAVGALGVEAHLGRGFTEEDARGPGDVVVLSHAFWVERYGADRDVLGRRILLNDLPMTVVGVMPPDLGFPDEGVDLWRPLTDEALDPQERRSHNYLVLGRLAPDATLERARAEMAGIADQLAREHPEHMTGWGVNVVPLHEDLTAGVRTLLLVLLGGVATVLLITCANLANLLLARAVTREREMAVRGALGAGRGRILRQLLTESLVLAGVGGLVGVLVARPLLDGLLRVAPADIPLLERAGLDLRMLGFAAAVTVGCGVLFGLAPALHLSRARLGAALGRRRGGAGRGHVRLRSALLVAQVALSVVLVVGAGLFARSFRALQAVDPGFDPEGLVSMSVDLPSARYADVPEQEAFHARVIRRVALLPDVESAAGTTQEPGVVNGMTFSFAIEGREATNPSGREDDEELRAVTPGYFEVMGQELVRGRAFNALDRADAPPVVILNESLARKHWREGEAIGKRIAFRVGETPWREVVGVVEDVRLTSPDAEPVPGIYIPRAQRRWGWLTWNNVIARTRPGAEPAAVQSAMRDALLELDPELPPQALRTVEESFRERVAGRTFAMTLVAGFGGLALLLSVVGLYGLIAYGVARDRREIGVRIAVGAGRGDVVRRVLTRSFALTAVGAVLGVGGAFAASRLAESLLYGVSPVDWPTYAGTVAAMVSVALATAAVPAWRAANTDPARVLQVE